MLCNNVNCPHYIKPTKYSTAEKLEARRYGGLLLHRGGCKQSWCKLQKGKKRIT